MQASLRDETPRAQVATRHCRRAHEVAEQLQHKPGSRCTGLRLPTLPLERARCASAHPGGQDGPSPLDSDKESDARTPTQLALDLLKSARRAFSPRSTCRVAMRRARGSRNVCKRPHTSRREQKSKRSACEPAQGRATLLRRRLCSTWYRPGHGHQEGVRADEASPEAERRHARRSEEAG